uniref:Uncharacterized protein n=1 Tax=Ditylenchus dipsaci TaxID=166011 RepID=A0A915EBX3_9BILA
MIFASNLQTLQEVLVGLDNDERLKVANKLQTQIRPEISSAENIIQKRGGQVLFDPIDEQTSLLELFSRLSKDIAELGNYGAREMGDMMTKSVKQLLKNAVAEVNVLVEISKEVNHPVDTIKLSRKSKKDLKNAFCEIKKAFGIRIVVGNKVSAGITMLQFSLGSDERLDMARAALNFYMDVDVGMGVFVAAVNEAEKFLSSDDGRSGEWFFCRVPGCETTNLKMFTSRLDYYLHYLEMHRLHGQDPSA